MCGIWSFVNLRKKNLDIVKLFQDFNNLKHRGPDNSYFETYKNVIIGFHRLAIMDDTFKSNQPFIYENSMRTIIFICNGEIYNYKELIESHKLGDIQNDCMVIPEIYNKMRKEGNDFDFKHFIKEEVKGEFAFMLFEFDHLKNLKKVVACRDEIGVRPLYYHPYTDKSDSLFFTSEIKGGANFDDKLVEFPPGNIITYTLNELGNVLIDKHSFVSVYGTESHDLEDKYLYTCVQTSVINSVRRRLNADKPLAFLLSGGVDSSLVAAISAKILGKPIRTFCCGMNARAGEDAGEGTGEDANEGTDLKYARMVAKHIGSNHTEVFFTEKEGLDAIPDVIKTIESWDTTTVRASVGQYLVSKYISTHTDCKVVMVGEGADEVCSSYLFNWYAPNGTALDNVAKKYVWNIHQYDVKRADRCISRWGMEGRVPLLDPKFIKAYWQIPAEKRMPAYKGIEKWFLREAFNGTGILPDEVLWRKKEAFSDGVSGKRSWFQIIQEWVENKVTDEEMVAAAEKYPYCTPKTKEAYYYRRIFCEVFGERRQEIIPDYWQPKWLADGTEVTGYVDPSARVLDVYDKTG